MTNKAPDKRSNNLKGPFRDTVLKGSDLGELSCDMCADNAPLKVDRAGNMIANCPKIAGRCGSKRSFTTYEACREVALKAVNWRPEVKAIALELLNITGEDLPEPDISHDIAPETHGEDLLPSDDLTRDIAPKPSIVDDLPSGDDLPRDIETEPYEAPRDDLGGSEGGGGDNNVPDGDEPISLKNIGVFGAVVAIGSGFLYLMKGGR